jgi:hypothetical protein
MSSTENWTLGIALGLLGSIAINTGNNLQSLGLKSLQQEEQSTATNSPADKPSRTRKVPWLSPTPVKTAPLEDQNESQSEFVFVKVRRSPFESIAWIVGTIIFVSGSLLNFASYAFAAQSMLASLESVQFVTNLIFGRLLLKAKITETMLAGTVLTVTGTVLVSFVGYYPCIILLVDFVLTKLPHQRAYIKHILPSPGGAIQLKGNS